MISQSLPINAKNRSNLKQIDCDFTLLDMESTDQAAARHEQFSGLLVEKKAVEKIMFGRARQFRDGLMTCSRRIAPELAGQTNISEIERLLSREFRILQGFRLSKQMNTND